MRDTKKKKKKKKKTSTMVIHWTRSHSANAKRNKKKNSRRRKPQEIGKQARPSPWLLLLQRQSQRVTTAERPVKGRNIRVCGFFFYRTGAFHKSVMSSPQTDRQIPFGAV
jgi:hypothetical protein